MHGLGASDMKGGLAVMIELARFAAEHELAYDVGWLFFPREELGPGWNPLPAVFAAAPLIDEAALVDLPGADRQHAPARLPREPQRARRVRGPRGALGAALARRERDRARARGAARRARARAADVEIDGLVFREVCRVTGIHGGHREQRDPGAGRGDVNFRFAPDRTRGAEARVRGLVGPAGSRLSNSPPGARRARARRWSTASRAGDLDGRAQAGLDERGRLRRARARRGQLRARRHALRTHGRRAGRDRGARTHLRRPRRSSPGSVRACRGALHPSSPSSTSIPSPASTTGSADARARGIDADRLRRRRPPRADARVHPRGAARRGRRGVRLPARDGPARAAHAIAAGFDRRFGVEVDPEREIVPTLGSKEAIFSFAQMSSLRRKRLVGFPSRRIRCTSAARCSRAPKWSAAAARAAAGCPISMRSTLGRDRRSSGRATRTTRPVPWPRSRSTKSSRRRARAHGFLLCSDEAYSELWFDEPPVSALQVADRENVVVFNTLSKRSSMTGYRCGFVCAPPEDCGAPAGLPADRRHRAAGVRAACGVAALGDESHVEDGSRACIGASARRCCRCSSRAGCGRPAARRRSTSGSLSAARRRPSRSGCSSTGILVAPGSFFGPAGEGYVRFALVPTQADCERAAEILRRCPVSDARSRSRRSTGARCASPSPTATSGWSTPRSRGDPRYFRERPMEPREVGPFEYHDKIPLKYGVRGARRARRPARGRTLRRVPRRAASC